MKKYIKQYDKRVGKTYVYENYPYWDKEKQQGRARRKLVGIWDEERQEIVPTRGTKRKTKTPNEKTKELPRFEMKHYGANHMVRWLAEDIGLVDDLAEIFPDDYEEILALANYIVVNPDSAMHLFEEWAQDHYVFNAQALNSQAISRLFQSITVNEEQQFFQRQVNKVAKDDLLVYDTTSISSYSDQLSDVTYGKSKDNSRLPQIKLAVLMTQKQGIPVLYRQLPGNMTDSRLVDQLIKTMAMHQLDDYQLVFDRGFYKRENIEHLLSKGAKFVLGARIDVRFIRDHIDQVRKTIDSTKHYLRSQKVYGVTVRDTTEFRASETSAYPMDVNIYYNHEVASIEKGTLDDQLLEWQALIEKDPSEMEACPLSRYFILEKDGVRIREDKVKAAKEYMGYFVLLSNTGHTKEEVLEIYSRKDVVEKGFHNIKDRLDMRRLRVSTDDSLRGKLFVQFVAQIILSHLQRRLSEAKRAQLIKEKETVSGIIIKLNRIRRFTDNQGTTYKTEVLDKQKDLLKALRIQEIR